MRLLVVDDDPAIRKMFARVLSTLGTVDEAANGIEALRALGQHHYDLMIVDWHMPAMDGAALLKTIASKPQGPNGRTPIIVVTADPTQHARTEALHSGAVYFAQKPVQLASLKVLALTAMQQHR